MEIENPELATKRTRLLYKMKGYKFKDHTADVLFEAYGKSLNEVFENSAYAFFDMTANRKTVEQKIKKDNSQEVIEKIRELDKCPIVISFQCNTIFISN